MVFGMTAFARCSTQKDWGSATWELRTVNHRYLEISLRLPELVRDLEHLLRERVSRHLKRGKVECFLKYQADVAHRSLAVNHTLLQHLAQAAEEVKLQWPQANQPNLLNILSWPEVLNPVDIDITTIREDVGLLLDNALKDLVAMRQREGGGLQQFIEERIKTMEVHMEKIRTRMPIVLTQQHNRVMERIKEFKLELNPERIEQEWLILAQKMDIMEELDRLQIHIAELRRALAEGGLIGRRLDFLTQELHREANTLCSKSTDAEVTHAGVELKVLIEQIREQVQNIE